MDSFNRYSNTFSSGFNALGGKVSSGMLTGIAIAVGCLSIITWVCTLVAAIQSRKNKDSDKASGDTYRSSVVAAISSTITTVSMIALVIYIFLKKPVPKV